MSAKLMNVAIVGCGRIAPRHLSAIADLKDQARLVAVCDLVEQRARAKATECSVPWYLDYHEMMARHPEIELVHVLVPSGLHAAVVVDLARYGRHILTEKPMALRVADCDAMIRACQQSGAQLHVVYQNRYNGPVVAIRQALDAERFGKLVLGTVRVRWCRHQKYYQADHWHGTWALDGGVMSQQASHHLDLLQYLLGPVSTVQCQTATRLLDIEVEDTAAAILRFANGALGIFEATVAARPGDLEGSLSLLGEHGSAVVEGFAVNELRTWQFAAAQAADQGLGDQVSQQVTSVYGNGHLPYIRDLILHLRDGAEIPSLCDAAAGRRNIELLTALYESAARGGQVVPPGVECVHSRLGCPPVAIPARSV